MPYGKLSYRPSGAPAASEKTVNEARALADMRVQRHPVQFVAQDGVGWDLLPRAAEIGLPLAVLPLVRLDRPAIILGGSDEEIIRKVESMPGAVGLVDVYSITGAVQVIKIGGKLPLESGYPLHGN